MFVFSSSFSFHSTAFHSTNSVSFVLDAQGMRCYFTSYNLWMCVCVCVRAMLFKTFNNFIHSLFPYCVSFFPCHSSFSNPSHPLFQLHGLSKLDVFFSRLLLCLLYHSIEHMSSTSIYYSFCKIRYLRFCVMRFSRVCLFSRFDSIGPHNIHRC